MQENLQLPPLQLRRKNLRLQFFYKIANGLLTAIAPDQYLEPNQNSNSKSIKIPNNKGTDQYKNSFIRTIPEWNGLSDHIVTAESR